MGPPLMRRPPRYCHGFIDRHGKPRWYFRRAGFKKIPLPGLPWSPAFMEVYETALAGQPVQIGSARTKPGTVRALAVSYFNSPDFRSLRPSSQAIYRGIVDRFCIQYGDNRIANLKREHVVKLMAARAERPGSANNLRKVLRAMMRHAVEIGLREDDPTRDVRAIRVKSDGFHSWNDDEIAQFEKRHPMGTPARLALALLLYTGQRRSDIVRIGPQHIRKGVLHVRQQKTGIELAIPIHPTLAAVIAETPTQHLTFLTNQWGRPFTAGYFGQWFRAQCDMAGLRNCSAHGLRKAAARRLAEAGCTAHEIAAITGHASLKEVERYTKAVDQQKLAAAAMEKTGTSSGQPYARLAKKRKKL
jgi:integrase